MELFSIKIRCTFQLVSTDNKVYSNMKEKTPDFLIQLFFMRNRI